MGLPDTHKANRYLEKSLRTGFSTNCMLNLKKKRKMLKTDPHHCKPLGLLPQVPSLGGLGILIPVYPVFASNTHAFSSIGTVKGMSQPGAFIRSSKAMVGT